MQKYMALTVTQTGDTQKEAADKAEKQLNTIIEGATDLEVISMHTACTATEYEHRDGYLAYDYSFTITLIIKEVK